jgi:Kef-type K+ transport system membrane component KefB
MTFLLVVVLAVVVAGELIGVNVIIGAFVAGMAFGRAPEAEPEDILRQKIESAGFGVFIPFFFLTAGMKTDPRVLLQSWANAALILSTLAALVASKTISGWCALRCAGFPGLVSISGGLLTVPMLSATLAGGAVGVELGILEPRFFNAIVILCVVTTLCGLTFAKPLLAKHLPARRSTASTAGTSAPC